MHERTLLRSHRHDDQCQVHKVIISARKLILADNLKKKGKMSARKPLSVKNSDHTRKPLGGGVKGKKKDRYPFPILDIPSLVASLNGILRDAAGFGPMTLTGDDLKNISVNIMFIVQYSLRNHSNLIIYFSWCIQYKEINIFSRQRRFR